MEPRPRPMIDRHFIYFPVRELFADPAAIGLAYEDVAFAASDGVSLHGWFVPGRSDLTLLWCHGNGGNISHRLENLLLVHNELGLNVFLFDYRGYGRSEGKPSEQGTYLDAEAALHYLDSRNDIHQDRTIYLGSSLGGGVAVELAMLRSPYGLILESTFPSIRYMARLSFPILPLHLFLQARYDSEAKIGRIDTPLLILHGDKDDLVPIQAGRRLFDAAKDPKEFHTIVGAGHNDTYLVGGKAYWDAMGSFIDRLGR